MSISFKLKNITSPWEKCIYPPVKQGAITMTLAFERAGCVFDYCKFNHNSNRNYSYPYKDKNLVSSIIRNVVVTKTSGAGTIESESIRGRFGVFVKISYVKQDPSVSFYVFQVDEQGSAIVEHALLTAGGQAVALEGTITLPPDIEICFGSFSPSPRFRMSGTNCVEPFTHAYTIEASGKSKNNHYARVSTQLKLESTTTIISLYKRFLGLGERLLNVDITDIYSYLHGSTLDRIPKRKYSGGKMEDFGPLLTSIFRYLVANNNSVVVAPPHNEHKRLFSNVSLASFALNKDFSWITTDGLIARLAYLESGDGTDRKPTASGYKSINFQLGFSLDSIDKLANFDYGHAREIDSSLYVSDVIDAAIKTQTTGSGSITNKILKAESEKYLQNPSAYLGPGDPLLFKDMPLPSAYIRHGLPSNLLNFSNYTSLASSLGGQSSIKMSPQNEEKKSQMGNDVEVLQELKPGLRSASDVLQQNTYPSSQTTERMGGGIEDERDVNAIPIPNKLPAVNKKYLEGDVFNDIVQTRDRVERDLHLSSVPFQLFNNLGAARRFFLSKIFEMKCNPPVARLSSTFIYSTYGSKVAFVLAGRGLDAFVPFGFIGTIVLIITRKQFDDNKDEYTKRIGTDYAILVVEHGTCADRRLAALQCADKLKLDTFMMLDDNISELRTDPHSGTFWHVFNLMEEALTKNDTYICGFHNTNGSSLSYPSKIFMINRELIIKEHGSFPFLDLLPAPDQSFLPMEDYYMHMALYWYKMRYLKRVSLPGSISSNGDIAVSLSVLPKEQISYQKVQVGANLAVKNLHKADQWQKVPAIQDSSRPASFFVVKCMHSIIKNTQERIKIRHSELLERKKQLKILYDGLNLKGLEEATDEINEDIVGVLKQQQLKALRTYQSQYVNHAIKSCEIGVPSIIKAPTGSGKTRIMMALCLLDRRLTQSIGDVFIVTPSILLTKQIFREFVKLGLHRGIPLIPVHSGGNAITATDFKGYYPDNDKVNEPQYRGIYFFCCDSFIQISKAMPKNHPQFWRATRFFDESHSIFRPSRLGVIKPSHIISDAGLNYLISATPTKYKGYGQYPFKISSSQLSQNGVLSKVEPIRIYDPNLSDILEIVRNHGNSRGMIVMRSVNDMRLLAEEYVKLYGSRCFEIVHSNVSNGKEVVGKYELNTGANTVVLVDRMLLTGYDDPLLQFVIVYRTEVNAKTFTQIAGRLARVNPQQRNEAKSLYICHYEGGNKKSDTSQFERHWFQGTQPTIKTPHTDADKFDLDDYNGTNLAIQRNLARHLPDQQQENGNSIFNNSRLQLEPNESVTPTRNQLDLKRKLPQSYKENLTGGNKEQGNSLEGQFAVHKQQKK